MTTTAIEPKPLVEMAPLIAAELAKITGLDWTYHPPADPQGRPYTTNDVWGELRTAENQGILLYVSGGYGARMEVSGLWPMDPDRRGDVRMTPHEYPHLHRQLLNGWRRAITVARIRSPAAIAKDIARRFLSRYDAIWDLIDAERHQRAARKILRLKAGASLVEHFGGKLVGEKDFRYEAGQVLYEHQGLTFRTYDGKEWALCADRNSSAVLQIPDAMIGDFLVTLARIQAYKDLE